MKQYFINDFEVSENTYKQYLDKEFKRVETNCKRLDRAIYTCHSKIILNNIKFEERGV
jgi:hypothetical protein